MCGIGYELVGPFETGQSSSDSTVETKLGLPQGYFNNAQVAVIDNPSVRMPTGNEAGANNQWIPGGYTSGGIPEATLTGTTNINDVTVITPGELFNGR